MKSFIMAIALVMIVATAYAECRVVSVVTDDGSVYVYTICDN